MINAMEKKRRRRMGSIEGGHCNVKEDGYGRLHSEGDT